MHAVILAGGLGSRLRPFSLSIPKPLMPVGDRPIIDILLTQLNASGFTTATVLLGYMAPLFKAFIGEGQQWNMRIEYVVEDQPLGTAGAIRLLQDPPENFLVVNGDTLTDLAFAEMFDSHVRSKAIATMFSARVQEKVDYGVVSFDREGTLTRYDEKPTREYHVSTGVYILSSRILQFDTGEGRLDMPDLLRTAMEAGERVHCHQSDSTYWRDIGRFDHLEAATQDFSSMKHRFIKGSERAQS